MASEIESLYERFLHFSQESLFYSQNAPVIIQQINSILQLTNSLTEKISLFHVEWNGINDFCGYLGSENRDYAFDTLALLIDRVLRMMVVFVNGRDSGSKSFRGYNAVFGDACKAKVAISTFFSLEIEAQTAIKRREIVAIDKIRSMKKQLDDLLIMLDNVVSICVDLRYYFDRIKQVGMDSDFVNPMNKLFSQFESFLYADYVHHVRIDY